MPETIWPTKPLREVVRPIARTVTVESGTSYRTLGVKWWGEGAYERETIDGSRTAAKTLSLVREGDLIINKIWVRHGSTAVVPKTVDGCAASGEFPTFLPEPDQVMPRWLHWLTKTRAFWNECDKLSRGTSGKNRIKPELFLTIEVPIPELAEQWRIVARIEELASKIEGARELRKSASMKAQMLLNAASGMAYDTASQHGAKRLDALCHIITDGTHVTPTYLDSGIPFLSVKDITTGVIRFDSCRYISPTEHALLTKRSKPERGDVLLTKVGTTGYAKAIDVDREFSIFVSLALLKLRRELLNPRFAEAMLNSPRLRELSVSGTRGVGNKNLVLKFIREFPMPLPPLKEQERIVGKLDVQRGVINKLCDQQAATAAELDALLPSILDKAFKGEL